MRIKLELDDFKFATTSWEFGDLRWLIIDFKGKKFSVHRSIESGFIWGDRDAHLQPIDRHLIDEMGAILEQILTDAILAIPAGTAINLRQETFNG